MKEKIYNLFFYIDKNVLTSLGLREHLYGGTDEEKIQLLKSSVDDDFRNCLKKSVDSNILVNSNDKVDGYINIPSSDIDVTYFEKLLSECDEQNDILYVITPVVDGKPKTDAVADQKYITKYAKEEGFDFNELIDDDYFNAIRMLFNNRKYVSCSKLIVSFIDTISYLEFGDVQGAFVKWLNEFSRIESLSITPNELWEFRNSILHMTNLNSRKILSGKEKRIRFIVTKRWSKKYPIYYEGDKLFNLSDLIYVLSECIGEWVKKMNANREKYQLFFERYDTIVSDERMIHYSGDISS
mgnify:CR=1 FL=1